MPGGFEPPITHDPPCHFCGHAAHILVCSETCGCALGGLQLGIDTALLGG